jgi:hypothetical protein
MVGLATANNICDGLFNILRRLRRDSGPVIFLKNPKTRQPGFGE